MWEDRAAEIRALRPRLVRLFIQEYFDLLPTRGTYNFGTLDRSVDLILKTGTKPLINMDFKPSLLHPSIDRDIVEPNDRAEWERLIVALVKHCKDRGTGIQYWEIAMSPTLAKMEVVRTASGRTTIPLTTSTLWTRCPGLTLPRESAGPPLRHGNHRSCPLCSHFVRGAVRLFTSSPSTYTATIRRNFDAP